VGTNPQRHRIVDGKVCRIPHAPEGATAVAIDAFAAHMTQQVPLADSGDARIDLLEHVRQVAGVPRTSLIWQRGVDRRQLLPEVSVDTAIDVLFSPIIFRLLVGHAPIDPDAIAALVEAVLTGLVIPQDATHRETRTPPMGNTTVPAPPHSGRSGSSVDRWIECMLIERSPGLSAHSPQVRRQHPRLPDDLESEPVGEAHVLGLGGLQPGDSSVLVELLAQQDQYRTTHPR